MAIYLLWKAPETGTGFWNSVFFYKVLDVLPPLP
jgi:hypothetical protein